MVCRRERLRGRWCDERSTVLGIWSAVEAQQRAVGDLSWRSRDDNMMEDLEWLLSQVHRGKAGLVVRIARARTKLSYQSAIRATGVLSNSKTRRVLSGRTENFVVGYVCSCRSETRLLCSEELLKNALAGEVVCSLCRVCLVCRVGCLPRPILRRLRFVTSSPNWHWAVTGYCREPGGWLGLLTQKIGAATATGVQARSVRELGIANAMWGLRLSTPYLGT